MNSTSIEKSALIAALEKRRAFWKKQDEDVTKKHAAAEKLALEKFRADLVTAAKLTYPAAVNKYGSSRNGLTIKSPPCPTLYSDDLEQKLEALGHDSRKTFNFDHRDPLHHLLYFNPKAKRSPCNVEDDEYDD